MSRIFAVILALSVSTTSWGALPKTWKQIANNAKYKKTPSVEEVQAPAVRATGEIQTYVLADRYMFLFDKVGVPIVGFDLTMEPIGWKEMIMGAVGIGAWSFKGFLNKYKKIKENQGSILRQEALPEGVVPYGEGSEAQEDYDLYQQMDETGQKYVTDWSDKDIAKGYKEFAKLKFNDDWIKANGGIQALNSGQKDGFKPASFSLADLYLETKQKSGLHAAMNEFAKVVYGSELPAADLSLFMKQFKMNWSEEKKEFEMKWTPHVFTSARGLKTPEIPGWVLNYQNPLDILAYKYSLENVQKYAAGLESIIPATYAHIVGIMISRVVNGMKSRLDGHENQMLALFEGALRGDYRIDISLLEPEKFIKTSILMLYLNKMIDTDDVTDAVAKMKTVMQAEAKYREENLKWLQKKEYGYKVWSDGRFATIYQNGKRKGIMSLAMKPMLITKHPGMHYYDGAPWLKTFSRVGMEVFVDAVRVYMPTQINFSQWLAQWLNIGIAIYIPGEAWDMIFRSRIFGEMAYEGQAIAQMNETLKGRWKEIPGYDKVELGNMLNHMTGSRTNAFEIPRKYEDVAIPKHMEMVKKMISGGTIAPAYLKQ